MHSQRSKGTGSGGGDRLPLAEETCCLSGRPTGGNRRLLALLLPDASGLSFLLAEKKEKRRF